MLTYVCLCNAYLHTYVYIQYGAAPNDMLSIAVYVNIINDS